MNCLQTCLVGALFVFVSVVTSPTTKNSSTISKVCPESFGYHRKTGQCAKLGERGHCGKLMTMSLLNEALNDDVVCSCQMFSKFTGCPSRPLIFWKSKNRCYPLFDQGPCKFGEWLVVDSNRNPSCKINICSTSFQFSFRAKGNGDHDEIKKLERNSPFVFSYEGNCFQTNTLAFCQTDQVAYFEPKSIFPDCFNKSEMTSKCSASGQPQTINVGHDFPCPNGTRRDSMGMCEPIVNF